MTEKLPLHERIRREVEADILSGALAPGSRIPFEHELMARHGCSRMTVNKALSALAAAGLIDRRKRAGSFVARPKVHSMILDIPDIEAQVRERGEAYAFEPIASAVRAPDPDDPGECEVAGTGDLLVIDGLHRADGRALAIEHRLIALAAVPEAAGMDLAAGSPGAWLLRHVPWTEAETRFAAINADRAIARGLDLNPRDACLMIERRTWRGPDRITLVRQIFAPGTHDLVARFGHRHEG